MSELSILANKKKVAIYIRVSTHWQIDKDSLQVQKRELIAYAEMVLGITDYVIFEDPGYSAKNTDRPAYQLMMDRLRTGEFTHLLVWKIDRISRNLLDFASMHSELKKLGVAFVSKNEQFDTSSAIGEAMLKIILVFAELERNMTSERVTAVMLSRANNGQWNGGKVPYGYIYEKEDKIFLSHPDEANVVKYIYNTYEQYQSVLYVARSLNDKGYRTRQGKEWSTNTVYKILTSVFYIGQYRYNVHDEGTEYKVRSESEWITIEEHHIPLITREQYDRVNFILKRNKRGGVPEGETYIKKNIHIFAGIIRCGACGCNMTATLDRRRADGWRPSIYACSKRRKNDGECSNKYISDIKLGPFVFNYIANIIRAKNNVSGRTSTDVLERKLLRGEAFADVEHIGTEGLEQLLDIFSSGETGMEYVPPSIFDAGDNSSANERQHLLEQKNRHETALNRLKSLYLYGEKDTPEKDYIIERQNILGEIEKIDARLAEIKSDEEQTIAQSDELIEKASYFIMVEKLLDERYIDYEKYIRNIDASIPRNFIKNIIKYITVTDGRVTKIAFKNGMEHEFTYKA